MFIRPVAPSCIQRYCELLLNDMAPISLVEIFLSKTPCRKFSWSNSWRKHEVSIIRKSALICCSRAKNKIKNISLVPDAFGPQRPFDPGPLGFSFGFIWSRDTLDQFDSFGPRIHLVQDSFGPGKPWTNLTPLVPGHSGPI